MKKNFRKFEIFLYQFWIFFERVGFCLKNISIVIDIKSKVMYLNKQVYIGFELDLFFFKYEFVNIDFLRNRECIFYRYNY